MMDCLYLDDCNNKTLDKLTAPRDLVLAHVLKW